MSEKYKIEIGLHFKASSDAKESLTIHASENEFRMHFYHPNDDDVIFIDLTPKSARILSQQLELAADFMEKIGGQTWGAYPVDTPSKTPEEGG